jgi:hypothetical protein
MAAPNYKGEKRRKDIAKLVKKKEKAERKKAEKDGTVQKPDDTAGADAYLQ